MQIQNNKSLFSECTWLLFWKKMHVLPWVKLEPNPTTERYSALEQMQEDSLFCGIAQSSILCFFILQWSRLWCLLVIILELAEVPLLLDQLDVVMLAVELPLVRDVVGRADGASSMAALEAALVIHSVVDSNLKDWWVSQSAYCYSCKLTLKRYDIPVTFSYFFQHKVS